MAIISNEKYDIRALKEKARRLLNMESDTLSDDEARSLIEDMILDDEALSHLTFDELSAVVRRIFLAVRCGMDVLQPLVDDPKVNEIMVNGKDDVFIEKDGSVVKTDISFDTTEELEEVIRRIASSVNREINELNPIVDARLADGSRVNAVYRNIALNGPMLTIRKFAEKGFSMDDMIRLGTITQECADILEVLVRDGYNCFISGGTSSGKTTFLNVLAGSIPPEERLIVIEDSAELRIDHSENIVRMECRNANAAGKGEIGMDALIRTSLRMRPDRIIVGEVRGREVMDMINAMNTGHSGSLSTGHGNSVEGMLRRLESMFLSAAEFPIEAIRAQIAEGIDIMIHLGRLAGGERKVLEVAEIYPDGLGVIRTNKLFSYSAFGGLTRTENRLRSREKLKLRGDEDIDI